MKLELYNVVRYMALKINISKIKLAPCHGENRMNDCNSGDYGILQFGVGYILGVH